MICKVVDALRSLYVPSVLGSASILVLVFAHPTPAMATTPLTFAAIQTAVDSCPVTGCTIKLACNPVGGDSLPPAGNGASRVLIGAKKNIRIQGCGMDATTLEWHAPIPPGNNWFFQMFGIIPGSDPGGAANITFQDMTLWLEVICGSGSQDCASMGSAVRIVGNVEGVKFERVRFKSTLQGTNNGALQGEDNYPMGLNVAWDATTFPEGVYVFNSRFETSGNGVSFWQCDDCWVEGSHFQDAPAIPATNKRALALLLKSRGEGVRINRNTFDMKPNTGPGKITYGVLLWRWFDDSGQIFAGEGAQVIGNTFENIPSSVEQRPIVLYGYNDAIIDSNRFRCDPAVSQGCANWGVETEGGCNGPCNRHNIISNNVFDRYIDDGTDCPILFKPPGGPDMSSNSENLVTGNTLLVLSAGSNGVCGPNEGVNTIVGNKVIQAP